MPIADALEFSNAMAALNCTGMGAWSHIADAAEARKLMRSAARREYPAIAAGVQVRAT